MKSKFGLSIIMLLIPAAWFAGMVLLALAGKGLHAVLGLDVYLWLGLPGLLLCGLFLRAQPKRRGTAGLILLAVIAGLYLVEFAALFVVPNSANIKDRRWKAAKKMGITYDRREPAEALVDLRREDETITLTYTPLLNQYIATEQNGGTPFIPLSGRSNRKTILRNERGDYAVYQSDRYGFRNPMDLSWDNPPDAMIVGDAFAIGCSVPDGEEASGQLRRLGRTVHNLGRLGSGPLLALGTMREYGPTLKPKHVFWFFYEGTDLTGLANEQRVKTLKSYLDPTFSQKLIDRQEDVDALCDRMDRLQLTGFVKRNDKVRRLMQFVKLRRSIMLLRKSKGFTPPDGLFDELMGQAKQCAESWGGELVFVYLPGSMRYSSKSLPDHEFHRPDILQRVQTLDIPVIDLCLRFEREDDPLGFYPYRLPGHYTPEGYGLVAEEIVDWLNQKP
ncbi:MAG: hypothetical protein AAF492_13010 [Verrucomicrobiota bacterium]